METRVMMEKVVMRVLSKTINGTFRFLYGKKAQASPGTAMPMQAIIEIAMVTVLFMAAVGYSMYIITDAGIFQRYYAPDMSLVQDMMIVAPDEIIFAYNVLDRSRYVDLDFEFSRHYTSVINEKEENKQAVEASYIHLENQYLVSSRTFFNADQIFFRSLGTGIGSLRNSVAVSDQEFPPEEIFFEEKECVEDNDFSQKIRGNSFFYFVTYGFDDYPDFDLKQVYDPLGSLNQEKYNFVSEEYFMSDQVSGNIEIIYIGIKGVDKSDENNEIIQVYAPSGIKGVFGCKLNNFIAEDIKSMTNSRVTVNLVYTNSIESRTEGKNIVYATYVEVSRKNLDIVLRNIKKAIDRN